MIYVCMHFRLKSSFVKVASVFPLSLEGIPPFKGGLSFLPLRGILLWAAKLSDRQPSPDGEGAPQGRMG